MEQNNELQSLSENKQNNPNKNIAAVVVLVIVLVAGGYFIFQNKIWNLKEKRMKDMPKNVVTPQIARVSANNLQKEMPANFPKEIPLNGKIKVIESYSAAYPNSTTKQSTISFQSSKTSKENYDFYSKWAKDNKWEIKNSLKQENLMSLYLQKNQTVLNITINPKTSSNAKSEVNVTYAEF